MSYEQTLWKEVKDVVNPKILAKNNRFKKWEYGYNSNYDFVVISKTGKIGQIIEIQNLFFIFANIQVIFIIILYERYKNCTK